MVIIKLKNNKTIHLFRKKRGFQVGPVDKLYFLALNIAYLFVK